MTILVINFIFIQFYLFIYLFIYFAGASPKLRDYGRKLCAEEWARFTGRYDCADAISKFTKAKRFVLRTRFQTTRNKSCSEPDLSIQDTGDNSDANGQNLDNGSHHRNRQGWFRKKFKKILHIPHDAFSKHGNDSDLGHSPFQMIARCVSTPLIPGAISPSDSPPSMRRNNSTESVKIPRVEVTCPDIGVVSKHLEKMTDSSKHIDTSSKKSTDQRWRNSFLFCLLFFWHILSFLTPFSFLIGQFLMTSQMCIKYAQKWAFLSLGNRKIMRK